MIKTNKNKTKWYNYYRFPLIPYLEIKKANKYNTSNFNFKWLVFELWSLDTFEFEVSFVVTNHWGVGFIGILPYLRWVVCIPIPYKIQRWIEKFLHRKSESNKEFLWK